MENIDKTLEFCNVYDQLKAHFINTIKIKFKIFYKCNVIWFNVLN